MAQSRLLRVPGGRARASPPTTAPTRATTPATMAPARPEPVADHTGLGGPRCDKPEASDQGDGEGDSDRRTGACHEAPPCMAPLIDTLALGTRRRIGRI